MFEVLLSVNIRHCGVRVESHEYHLSFQGQEKELQDKLSDDSKELDKITNKQSVLLKKVIFV